MDGSAQIRSIQSDRKGADPGSDVALMPQLNMFTETVRLVLDQRASALHLLDLRRLRSVQI